MKILKYPNLNFLNFGVRNGELYAGDLSESGRRIPFPVSVVRSTNTLSQPSRLNNDLLNSRNGDTSRGTDGYGVDVDGEMIVQYATETPRRYISELFRGMPMAPFLSKLGSTKGNSYTSYGTSMIVDSNNDTAFNIFSSSTSFSGVTSLVYQLVTAAAYSGISNIVCETEDFFLLRTMGKSESGSLLLRVSKVQNATADIATVVLAGAFDVEYIGKDSAGRLLLMLQLEGGWASQVISSLPNNDYAGNTVLLRENTANSMTFTAWEKTASAMQAGSGSYPYPIGSVGVSLSNNYVIRDPNGAVLSVSSLVSTDVGNTTGEVKLRPLQWMKRTTGDTVVRTSSQNIEWEGTLAQSMLRVGLAEGYTVHAHPIVSGQTLYVVVTLGTVTRAKGVFYQPLPVVIITQEIDVDGLLVGSPTFTEIPITLPYAPNAFSRSLVDAKNLRVWQIADDSYTHQKVTIRCIDILSHAIDETTLHGEFTSAGVHEGQLLVTVNERAGIGKYVLNFQKQPHEIQLSFDKTLYARGETGTLTVSCDIAVELTVELDGCAFLDSSDSKAVSIAAGTPTLLPVTITSKPTATVAFVSLPQEIVV